MTERAKKWWFSLLALYFCLHFSVELTGKDYWLCCILLYLYIIKYISLQIILPASLILTCFSLSSQWPSYSFSQPCLTFSAELKAIQHHAHSHNKNYAKFIHLRHPPVSHGRQHTALLLSDDPYDRCFTAPLVENDVASTAPTLLNLGKYYTETASIWKTRPIRPCGYICSRLHAHTLHS